MRELQFQITGFSEDDTRQWRRPSRRPTPARAIGLGLLGVAVIYLLAGAKTSGRVEIISPVSGATTLDAQILVSGRASNIQADAVDLDVNGSLQTVPASEGAFEAQVSLALGVNAIRASADGIPSDPITIFRKAQPVVRISSPSEKFVTTQAAVEITGVLENSEERAVTLDVNGNTQAVTVADARFSAMVPLVAGRNVIKALIAGASPAVVEVSRLETGIAITSPSDGFTTDLATVIVAGTVENVETGTITLKSDQLSRTVQAQNGSFNSEVGLHLGDNKFQASVGDALSNEIVVHRIAPPVIIALTSPQSGPTQNTVASVRGTVQNARNNTITLTVNGSSRAVPIAGSGFTAEARLELGANRIQASQGDAVSNEVVVTRQPLPTLIKIISPQSGLNRNSSVRVAGTITNPQGSTITLTINGSSRALDIINGGFASDVELGIGDNHIQASQGGVFSNEIVVNRPPLPVLIRIISPLSGPNKNSSVKVTGRIQNSRGPTITLTVNGSSRALDIANGGFSSDVELGIGENRIQASQGGAVSNEVVVNRPALPALIKIVSPQSGSTRDPVVTVTGRVVNAPGNVNTITLTVNRSSSRVQIKDGSFNTRVDLVPGDNLIEASIPGASDQIRLVRLVRPEVKIVIISPRDGTTTKRPSIPVTGRVENSDAGTIMLTVNRNPMQVPLRFGEFRSEVSLSSGKNFIQASLGSVTSQVVTVTVETRVENPAIQIISPRSGPAREPVVIVTGRVVNPRGDPITLTVNRSPVPVQTTPGGFTARVQLVSGDNLIEASIPGASDQIRLIRLVRPEVKIVIVSPRDGTTTKRPSIPVTGRVENSDVGTITLTVNRSSFPVGVNQGEFRSEVKLSPGKNVIQASLGSVRSQVVTVTLQTGGDDTNNTSDECSKINCDCKNVRGSRIATDAWSRAFGSRVTEQPPIFTARVSAPPQDRQAQCRSAEETLRRRCKATGRVSGACPPDASGPNAWPSSDKKRSFPIPKKQGANKP